MRLSAHLLLRKFLIPLSRFPLALISHFGADAFPHWDTATNFKIKGRRRLFVDSFIDVGISFFVPLASLLLFPETNLLYSYIVVFFALLPDWLTAPYFFFGQKYPPFSWVYRLQKVFDNRLDKPWGIIGQALVLLYLIVFAVIL